MLSGVAYGTQLHITIYDIFSPSVSTCGCLPPICIAVVMFSSYFRMFPFSDFRFRFEARRFSHTRHIHHYVHSGHVKNDFRPNDTKAGYRLRMTAPCVASGNVSLSNGSFNRIQKIQPALKQQKLSWFPFTALMSATSKPNRLKSSEKTKQLFTMN